MAIDKIWSKLCFCLSIAWLTWSPLTPVPPGPGWPQSHFLSCHPKSIAQTLSPSALNAHESHIAPFNTLECRAPGRLWNENPSRLPKSVVAWDWLLIKCLVGESLIIEEKSLKLPLRVIQSLESSHHKSVDQRSKRHLKESSYITRQAHGNLLLQWMQTGISDQTFSQFKYFWLEVA